MKAKPLKFMYPITNNVHSMKYEQFILVRAYFVHNYYNIDLVQAQRAYCAAST